ATDLALDLVDLTDLLQSSSCNRRTIRDIHLIVLAACVCPTGRLDDLTTGVQWSEPAVGIGLQDPDEGAQVLARPLGFAIGRVTIDYRRRIGSTAWSIISHIGPQPTGSRATLPR